jgi:hypothetical protein
VPFDGKCVDVSGKGSESLSRKRLTSWLVAAKGGRTLGCNKKPTVNWRINTNSSLQPVFQSQARYIAKVLGVVRDEREIMDDRYGGNHEINGVNGPTNSKQLAIEATEYNGTWLVEVQNSDIVEQFVLNSVDEGLR